MSSSSTALGQSFVLNHAPLWQSTSVFAVANALGFLISLQWPHSHYHVDLLGTSAFGLAAVVPTLLLRSSASTFTTTTLWSAVAVLVWSSKLAGFLWYRVVQTRHDARLDDILARPPSALGFWMVSFLWGVVVSLPHTLGMTTAVRSTTASSSSSSSVSFVMGGSLQRGTQLFCQYSGIAFYLLGLVIETVADYQKWNFKQQQKQQQPRNSQTPPPFCNVGLWSLVQHPNWLGNLLLWSGIFLWNVPALVVETATTATLESSISSLGWSSSLLSVVWRYHRVGFALLGPTFLWRLFQAQVTGQILDDTRQATLQKYGYGVHAEYTHYIDTTPAILPDLGRMGRLQSIDRKKKL